MSGADARGRLLSFCRRRTCYAKTGWVAFADFGAALLLAATAGFADTITLALVPASGNVSGPPGSTVGWGYTITNNSSDRIQTQNITAGVFLDGTPNVIFDFPAVAPGRFRDA